MKATSFFALSALGLAILACGGGDDDGTTTTSNDDVAVDDDGTDGGDVTVSDLPTAALTKPWVDMNLPVANGKVVLSDSMVMLIAYEDASVSGLGSTWPGAVTNAGWEKSEDYSTDDFKAILYTKKGGKQQLGLAIGVEEGITFVYMEDLDKVPEGESTVRKAKSGKRGIVRARNASSRRGSANSRSRSKSKSSKSGRSGTVRGKSKSN